jgi:6-pyruvoyl-tetrahydropterin synthase
MIYLEEHPKLAPILAPLNCELILYSDPNTQGKSSEPYFQYSHGLKQHNGPCQRIVHGHRSQLKLFLDQQRMPTLERLWSRRWQDIYLGCEQDFKCSFVDMDVVYDEFAYQSEEGFYRIQLPRDRVYRLPESSTIECIAAYLANKIRVDYPHQHLQVQVYEGVQKGAIYELAP